MEASEGIEARRQTILEEMSRIRTVVRGTFAEQLLPVYHRDKKEPVLRGPYYVLARWQEGRTRSRRIKREDAPRVREGVRNYKRLKELCEEFAAVTERLGEVERERAARSAR